MTEQLIKEFEKSLRAALDYLKNDLSGVRTNRPSPKLVDNLKVHYMDQDFTILQLGSISILPPREIDISAWDKESVPAIAKAIETSGMGLTANTDGNLIRINLPTLTDERREELAKLVKSLSEQAKIKVRASRDDVNKKIEGMFKEKILTEDQKFKARKKAQDVVDKTNVEIESSLSAKIKELSE
ncbi:MAG: ribosome recycling factor [bacterium]|nr:ribosome recycling factor [bacterium]